MRGGDVIRLTAPAKLTLSLRVTGTRPDGFHLLEAEMVSLDLADTLVVSEGDQLVVDEQFAPDGAGPVGGAGGWRSAEVAPGPDNLVARALRSVGRTARVELIKRIPPGAGLGGGSADAAAILRWSGITDPDRAADLGADVPFCVHGGRALVRGIGEDVAPLPYEERSYTLFLLPFGMDTRAVYAAWDQLHPEHRLPEPEPGTGPAPARTRPTERGTRPAPLGVNDLETAAVTVDPRLGHWRDHLEGVTGRQLWLAGSGSTWFTAGGAAELGLEGRSDLRLGEERALVVPVRTVPAH